MRTWLLAGLGFLLFTGVVQAEELNLNREMNPLLNLRRKHHRHHCNRHSSSHSSDVFIPIPGPMGLQGLSGIPGPTGPTGATGAIGGAGVPGVSQSLADNYSSSYDDGTISFSIASTYADTGGIPFLSENIIPPVGITHPVNADSSIFQVNNSGVYHITWTVTFQTAGTSSIIQVQLADVTTLPGTPFPPTPFEQIFISGENDYSFVTGQTTLNLSAGDQIQLQAQADASPSALFRTFTITQIAPGPV